MCENQIVKAISDTVKYAFDIMNIADSFLPKDEDADAKFIATLLLRNPLIEIKFKGD